jgi:hypothetical protein
MTKLENYTILVNLVANSTADYNYRNRIIQGIIFDMTSTIMFRTEVRFEERSFKGSELLREHVMGRKSVSHIIMEKSIKQALTPQRFEELLQKHAFWINVPKAVGKNGKTVNGLLKKYQNGNEIITFEQYVKVLAACGWHLTKDSKERLKAKMNVK